MFLLSFIRFLFFFCFILITISTACVCVLQAVQYSITVFTLLCSRFFVLLAMHAVILLLVIFSVLFVFEVFLDFLRSF